MAFSRWWIEVKLILYSAIHKMHLTSRIGLTLAYSVQQGGGLPCPSALTKFLWVSVMQVWNKHDVYERTYMYVCYSHKLLSWVVLALLHKLDLLKTRSSAAAEKQRVSCPCLSIGWLINERAVHRTPQNHRGCTPNRIDTISAIRKRPTYVADEVFYIIIPTYMYIFQGHLSVCH